MEKQKKEMVCPLARCEDQWQAECELILKFFCPFASMPHMSEAMEKDFPECPHSWEGDEIK